MTFRQLASSIGIFTASTRCLQQCRSSAWVSTGWSCSFSTSVMSNTSSYLRNIHNGAEIFLVGTAHISRKSAEEVYDTIHFVKPDVIMVELCRERAAKLRAKDVQNSHSGGLWNQMKTMLDMFASSGGGIGTSFMDRLFKGFYRYLEVLGLEPGLEFKVAMEEADKLGAKLIYGDISGQETMKKITSTLTLPNLLKLLSSSGARAGSPEIQNIFNNMVDIEAVVEGMKRRAIVTEMQNCLEEINPQMIRALVHERDEHMVNTLLKLEGRVVAVVGLGHLNGIEKRWEAVQSRSMVPS